jgi:glutathione S-transferase
MILMGVYRSPFVRRVAISLRLLGIEFEHRALSPARDADELRRLNPLGRVPALLLDDGEVLVDSAAILDHLDQVAGVQRALVPSDPAERRRVLQLVALLAGVGEKSVAGFYERTRRPAELIHAPWAEHLDSQVAAGLAAVDARAREPFLAGDRLTQADVTAVAVLDFVRSIEPNLAPPGRYHRLDALYERCYRLPAFAETRPA